jgi:hypothetical protein
MVPRVMRQPSENPRPVSNFGWVRPECVIMWGGLVSSCRHSFAR